MKKNASTNDTNENWAVQSSDEKFFIRKKENQREIIKRKYKDTELINFPERCLQEKKQKAIFSR